MNDGRPRPKQTLSTVELDGELVVFDLTSGFLHHLDPLATLIWSCFDGSGTVDEIVDDLAAGFDVEARQVRADVVGLVERLNDAGLLLDGEDGSDAPTGVEPPPAPGEAVVVLTDPPSP